MSSLSQLIQKRKSGLQPTRTRVTRTDGTVSLYENQGSARVSSTLDLEPRSYGFVVDSKPDLSIGVLRPWLLISSQDPPNEERLIAEHGVTHILSLLPGFELNPAVSSRIKSHLCLDLFDEESFSLDPNGPIMAEALQFMSQVKGSPGARLLVHCNAGISRAPSLALLYCIKVEGMTFEEAWDLVHTARPNIKPNDGFLSQLKRL